MSHTHIVRLGTHAEKEYLLRAYAWFDEVALNANLVEGTASALSVFVTELRDKGKAYFIDPVTYAFALSPDYLRKASVSTTGRQSLKRTFSGLAGRYGPVVERCAGRIRLEPSHLASESDQAEFCDGVLRYQSEKLNEALLASDYFLMMEESAEPLIPSRLLAPYFHLSGDLEWLETNVSLARQALLQQPDCWVVVCIDSVLLDSKEAVDAIASHYAELRVPGFLVWATDFEEERATEGQISGLKSLIIRLASGGTKQVINMFGGYFSLLLSEFGLTGVSHGLGYGERRDIVPVLGGGLPPAKYYLPAIHEHIRIDQLVSIATQPQLDASLFAHNICDCVICTGLLRQGLDFLITQYSATETRIVNGRYREVATPQVYRLTRFHYLSNKNREFHTVELTDLETLLGHLDDAYQKFRGELGSSSLTYLITWRRALSS